MTWYLARRWFTNVTAFTIVLPVTIYLVLLPDSVAGYAFFALLLVPLVSRRSVSHFQATLPVAGRDFVFGRILGIGTLLMVPLVCWLLSSAIKSTALEPLFVLEVVCIGLLMRLVPETLESSRQTGFPRAADIAALFVATVGGVLLVRFAPPMLALVLLLGSTTLACALVLQRIPASITVSPHTIRKSDGRESVVTRWLKNDRSTPLWALTAKGFLTIPIMMQWLLSLLGGMSIQLPWMIALCAPALSMHLRQRVLWLAPLPLSVRSRALVLAVPAVLVTTMLVGIGNGIGMPGLNASYTMGRNSPTTPYAPGHYFNSKTRVPLAFWRVASDGVAPRITSRTGESCEPYTLSVAGVLLYNPYSSREENSSMFVAWQFARATSAVYGRMITPEAYAAASKKRALPPPMTESWRVRMLGGGALMSFLLLVLWLTEIARHPSMSAGIRRHLFGGLAHLPMFVIIGFDAYYVFREKVYVVGPLLQKGLVDLSIRLPHNPFVFALYLLLPVLTMYALFEWQFARSETIERIAPIPA